jgi:hypothetical protein
MHVCKMCFHHISFVTNIFQLAVATIISVPYKNIRSRNNLSKHANEPLDVKKNVSNVLQNQWISGYLLLKSNKTQFFKQSIKTRSIGLFS